MSITIEHHDGAVTYISDRGYGLLRAEQDNALLKAAKAKRNTSVDIGCCAGGILCLAALIAEALIRNS